MCISFFFLFPNWVGFFRDHQCHSKGNLPLSILTTPWTSAVGQSQETELQKRPFIQSRLAILMFLALSGVLVTAGHPKYTIMVDWWKGNKLIYNVELYFDKIPTWAISKNFYYLLSIPTNILGIFFLIFLSMPYCLMWNLEESTVVHLLSPLFSLDHWFIFIISDFH